MRARVRAGSKEVRDLVRKFRPGYRLVAGLGPYFHIECPDGELARDSRGAPLALPLSPGDITPYRARLRKAGVVD